MTKELAGDTQMFNKLKNILLRCKVTKAGDDAGIYPQNQIQSLGVVQNCQIISIYGINYNPPENTDGVAFDIMASSENKVAIFQGTLDRVQKGLKPGEIAIGSPLGGNYIKFLLDGGIEIHGKYLKQVIDEQASYKAASTSVESPINATGDVNVTGKIHATGEINSDTDVLSAGISGKLHTHTSAAPGADTSPPK